MKERNDRESEPLRKLFIGGLNAATTDETLREYFEHWGEVVDCVVIKDAARRSRGFGFITYKYSSMVDDAQKARPHRIDNRVVECKRATPKEDADKPESHITSTKLYVSGVKEGLDESDLSEYFSQFGNVQHVDIIVDRETRQRRGFAFVTFDDYDAVDKIVLTKTHRIKDYRCDTKKALSKEEMDRVKAGFGMSRGRGRGDYDAGRPGRGGFGRGFGGPGRFGDDDDFERAPRGGGYGAPRDYFNERDRFAEADDYRGPRDTNYGRDHMDRYDDFRDRDRYDGRDVRGGHDGFGGRGRGFDDRDRFESRGGPVGRDGFDDRFGGRDSYGGRDIGGRDGVRREGFSGREGFGGREGFPPREGFGGRPSGEFYGERDMGSHGRNDFHDRDERRGRDEGYGPVRDGSGPPPRAYEGSGAGFRAEQGREDMDRRQVGFGTGYGTSRGTGPVRSSSYTTRDPGPYAGGYGSGESRGGGRDPGHGGEPRYGNDYPSGGGGGGGGSGFHYGGRGSGSPAAGDYRSPSGFGRDGPSESYRSAGYSRGGGMESRGGAGGYGRGGGQSIGSGAYGGDRWW